MLLVSWNSAAAGRSDRPRSIRALLAVLFKPLVKHDTALNASELAKQFPCAQSRHRATIRTEVQPPACMIEEASMLAATQSTAVPTRMLCELIPDGSRCARLAF